MAKRRKRKKKRFIFKLIKLILFLALVIGLGIGFSYYFCGLKTVTVEGTDLYSDEEIKGYILDGDYSDNTVYVFVHNFLMPKGDAEFIDHFEVRMTGLNSININCVEKTILGYMKTETGYIYFDYDGKIAEISSTYVEGYMKVSKLEMEEPVIGEKLPIGDDKVGFLVAAIKLVEKEDLMPNAIEYDEFGRMTLIYDEYDICLGNSSYLEEKIDRLQYILPSIEGLSGTLHLENYSADNTDIVFEKATDEAE